MSGSNHAVRRSYLSDDSRELACGALVDEALEQVAEGDGERLNDHQQHCPHCQAAITEFNRIWSPVRRLADEPVPVMHEVERLVHDVGHTLQLTDQGAIRVAARVVAAIARGVARGVPGVRFVLGRTTQSHVADLITTATGSRWHPDSGVGVLGRTAVIDLAVAVTYGEQVHHVAHEIQRRVKAELQNNIGLQTIAVNVTVDKRVPARHDLAGTRLSRRTALDHSETGFHPEDAVRASGSSGRPEYT
jgi:uncharacterized alkaline shock family protein YloU